MNILISSNKKYLKPLEVMLYSLSKNTKQNEINVYFVNATLNNKEINKFKKFLGKINNIKLSIINIDKNIFEKLPLLEHISLETYTRLLLIDLIPKNIDKLLWLDADIVINKNIDDFYNIDLQDYYATVCESINKESYKLIEKLGLNQNQKYFNAGIILFNLKKLREDFDSEYFLNYAKSNLDKITWLDQDILNATIGHNCLFCNYKLYNYMHFTNTVLSDKDFEYLKNNTVVFHYIGRVKPWNYKFVGKTKNIWLDWAKKSKAYNTLFFFKDKLYSKCYTFLKYLYKSLQYIKYSFKNLFLKYKVKNIKILDPVQTIDYIEKNKSSISRFGDGEMLIMDNEGDIGFQKRDERLAKRLNEIISKKSNKDILICIPRWIFKKEDLNKRSKESQKWCKKYLVKHFLTWEKRVDISNLYGDTSFNRNYIGLKDKQNAAIMFDKLKKIWQDRDICIVEGNKSFCGKGNDLFDNAKSLVRIVCPAENAFNKYNEIFDECKKLNKDLLFLIALGPTATVLAYDLYELGYQAIDIGHLDIEYEWSKMKADYVVQVKGKYTNEAGGNDEIDETKDEKYEKQIIAKIIDN